MKFHTLSWFAVSILHLSTGPVAALPSGKLANCVAEALETNATERIISPDNEFYVDSRLGEKIQFEELPSLIVYAESPDEVAPVIQCARAADVKVVPRDGGHHFESFSALNNTLVLDLAHLDDVKVSEDRSTATVGAGIRLGALYIALDAYDTTFAGGICPTVGLAGLIASGGFNMQMRKLGISANYVLGAKVVTADGETLTVSATENEDLFWAIRGGGGGTFGIVTEFTLELTEMPRSSMLMIDWEDSESRFPVAKRFLEWAPKQTEDLTTQINIYRDTVGIIGWHYGASKEELEAVVAESGLLDIGNATVTAVEGCSTHNSRVFGYTTTECNDDVDVSILNVIQDPFEQYKDHPQFAYNEEPKSTDIPLAAPWERFIRLSKSFFILKDQMLDDETLQEVVDRVGELDEESEIWAEWHSWNIACPETDNAFAWCDDAYAHLEFQIHGSEDPEKHAVYEKWFSDLESLLRPAVGPASYSGYMDAGISVDPLTAYYGDNVCRLVDIKQKYDPDEFFTNPMSIPATLPDGISC